MFLRLDKALLDRIEEVKEYAKANRLWWSEVLPEDQNKYSVGINGEFSFTYMLSELSQLEIDLSPELSKVEWFQHLRVCRDDLKESIPHQLRVALATIFDFKEEFTYEWDDGPIAHIIAPFYEPEVAEG